MSIKEWPKEERPREKLLECGAAALNDAELLAILLRVGTRGMSTVNLTRYLLSKFGNLGELISTDAKTLPVCKDMGLASYIRSATVEEIGRRILDEDLQEQMILSNPESVTDYLRLHPGHEKTETGAALLLSRQSQLIAVRELSHGTVTENAVYIHEVVRLALDGYADSLILVHNHPGGSAGPSESDVQLTGRLKQALGLVDITPLDYFIVTVKETYSLHEQGYIQG